MLAGYDVWKDFSSFGLTRDEYEKLEKRMSYLKECADEYIECQDKPLEIIDNMELDFTVGYYYLEGSGVRLTPSFIHSCGAGWLGPSKVPEPLNSIAIEIMQRPLLPTVSDYAKRCLSMAHLMLRVVNSMAQSVDEPDCIFSLQVVDLCILEIMMLSAHARLVTE